MTVCSSCEHPLEHGIRVNPIRPTSSLVEGLLNFTDTPLSASDAAHVCAAAEQIKSDMENLGADVRALESTLTRLRSNREVLEKRSQHLAAIIAPIRHLPTDVLIQIFDTFTMAEYPGYRNNVALLCLCHVSRLWRAIILSTSAFWSCIYIRFPKKERAVESQTATVQHWLTYSRDSLLYVDIRIEDGSNVSLPHNPALELLVLQSHRWRDATLVLTLDEMSHYLSGVTGRIGQLRSLTMHLSGVWKSIDYFEDAPSLRTVSFDGFFPYPHPLRLPWDSLTHLTTESHYVPTIVPQCSSLASCDVTLRKYHVGPFLENMVELPHLPSFRVFNQNGGSSGWFYDSVTVSALHTFEVHDRWETQSSHIASFLSRSSHTLERLLLNVNPSFDVTACLEATPGLKHVNFQSAYGGGLTDGELRRIARKLTFPTNTLLPELVSMQFDVAYRRNETPSVFNDTFTAMIISRLSYKLRIVVIVIKSSSWDLFKDPLQEEDIVHFLRLCEVAGLHISVRRLAIQGHLQIYMTY